MKSLKKKPNKNRESTLELLGFLLFALPPDDDVGVVTVVAVVFVVTGDPTRSSKFVLFRNSSISNIGGGSRGFVEIGDGVGNNDGFCCGVGNNGCFVCGVGSNPGVGSNDGFVGNVIFVVVVGGFLAG